MKIDKGTKLKSRTDQIYTVVDIIMNSLTNEPLFYVLNNGLKIPQENIAPYGSKNPNYMYQIIGMKIMNKVTMKEVIAETKKKAYVECFHLSGDSCRYPSGAMQSTGKVIKKGEVCPYTPLSI